MEQAVEILLNYSHQPNAPSTTSFPVEHLSAQTVRSGDLANKIEQIDLTIASLTSQKIDYVQSEQYTAAQKYMIFGHYGFDIAQRYDISKIH